MPLLRYPNEAIDTSTDYLQIQILNYDRKKITGGSGLLRRSGPAFKSGSGSVKTLKNTILLPMPSNVQDGNSVSYSDSKLDGLTANVYGAIDQNILKSDDSDSLTQRITSSATGLAAAVFTTEAGEVFTRNLAARAANIPFGGNLSLGQVLAREKGEILNPNMELLFNNVTLRTFRFSFKLAPRDPREALEVKSIIRSLKKNMAVKGASSGTFLETPNIFKLTYRKGNQNHPFLHRFKDCALSDMNVQYTGDNVYATYADGTPVSMILNLTFKELLPIYAEDYDNSDDYNNSGGSIGFGEPGGGNFIYGTGESGSTPDNSQNIEGVGF